MARHVLLLLLFALCVATDLQRSSFANPVLVIVDNRGDALLIALLIALLLGFALGFSVAFVVFKWLLEKRIRAQETNFQTSCQLSP